MSGNRAPSCCLWYKDNMEGDILVNEVYVPATGAAKYTYYCCLQWNIGHDGGGYCGIQDHPDGKCYIFSLWDPVTNDEAIVPVFKGPGTFTERFGGEGTGLKSMNFELGWKTDRWYTIVVRRWDVDGNSTYFGCWIEDQEEQKWTHMITMKYPVPGVTFRPSTACFLEDWYGNGKSLRHVMFRNGFKRSVDKRWCHFSSAWFYVNKEDACKNYNENYDAGCLQDSSFFMQSGSNLIPSEDIKKCVNLSRKEVEQPNRPEIDFEITKATREKVEWQIAPSSAPQFHFSVTGPSAIDSESRECVLWSPETKICVTLEDILGRSATKSTLIS